MKTTTEENRSIGLVEVGAASKLTKGLAYIFPWYEQGVPPFIYACPYC
jgi:hypothetical protein